jgi:hypothetical protein
MAGHSRSKDGVAFARLCPAIHVLLVFEHKDVDARDGHDENKKAPAKPEPSENADDQNQRE